EIIAFFHYPPLLKNDILKNEVNDLVRLMEKYNIHQCYYGHLHANAIKDSINSKYLDIEFKLVSADAIDFKLIEV
ncbi:MAG: serine/threonine protein phosphatase, partial [Mycoplasmatota bacterium]